MKEKIIVTLILTLSAAFTGAAQNTEKDFLGTWEYVCHGAEYAYYTYYTGEIKIIKKENKIITSVKFVDDTKLTATNTRLKNGTLHFELYIEGNSIYVSLKNIKGKLIGKVTTSDSTNFELTTNKKKK
ncbi:hypothetical protein Q4Q39_10505 [Flavivirga amylovorans]|uniref:DUF5640 domain-containing protein n=1 Tax=Flavivirga amylovorans TaxID=870486 RepID=A0ABT8X1P0_9FLAO|nr:hypothetical protein [Flavivirga amylovorans]MDO5987831.1 hypothetical protein [Flavivirga amylovorans]